MSRYIGNYLRVPASEPTQSTAPGIWSISEQLAYQRANQWPPARDPYYNQTVLHLSGDVAGTRETNPVTQPRTFLSDASTNNFLLTPNGDVSARPFSPYGTSWSTYFVPTANASTAGSNFSIASPTPGLSFGTSDFTVECWVNKTKAQNVLILDTRSGVTATPWAFCIDGSNCPYFYDGVSYTSTVPIILNQWTHIAVTRASGTLRIFVNGIQGYSATVTTNLDRTAGAIIGAKVVTPDNAFDGYLSSLRVVKGQALYTTTFTPSTAPLTTTSQGAIASNVSLLAFQSNRFIDLTNNFTLTPSNSPSISQNSPFVSSDTTSGSGYFDGNADYLIAGDQTAFEFGAGDYTVECWWYPTTTTDQNIIGKWDAGGSEWILQWRSAGYYRWASNGNVISDTSSITLRLNAWNHISVTKTSGSLRIYSNGSQINTTASEGTISATTAQLTIGTSQLNSSPSYVTGYISDVRIVKGTAIAPPANAPTTPLQVVSGTSLLTLQTRAPANNQGILDTSPNSFVVTRNGNVAQGSFSPFSQSGWSNYYNGYAGTNLSLNPGTTIGAGQFSVESWIYPQPQPASGQAYVTQTIIFQGNNSNNNSWSLSFDPSTMRISWGYYGASTTVSASYLLSFNTWSHILVTRDSSNIERIFINGTLVNQRTSTQSYTGVNGTTIRLGSHLDSNWPSAYSLNQFGLTFCGYMSNTRVIAGNIPVEYQTTSTTLGAAIFTPSTSRLTNIAGTILLANQSNRFIDNSNYNSAITINYSTAPGVSVQPFSPFAPTQAYVASQLGGSGYFDGNDYLSLPDSDAWHFGTGDFTVEAWYYPTTTSAQQIIIGQWSGSVGGTGLSWVLMTSNDSNVYLRALASTDGSGVLFDLVSTSKLQINAWNHVVLVRSGSTFQLYINGATASSGSTTSASALYNSPNILTIGSSSAGAQYVTGFVSGVRVIKGTAAYFGSTYLVPTAPPAPTQNTSLLLNFTGAGIVDATGKNVVETVGNSAVQTRTIQYGTGSMYFDGSDYLIDNLYTNQNYAFGSGNWTIEGWFYNQNVSGSSGNVYLISIWGIVGQADTTYSQFVFRATNNNLEIVLQPTGGAGLTVITGTGNGLTANTWQHLAAVRYGNNVSLYINGTSVASTPYTSTLNNPASRLVLGAQLSGGAGTYYYTGYMDDIRITKGIARYTSNFNTNLPPGPFPLA